MPRSDNPNRAGSLVARTYRAWRTRGLSALIQRAAWKCGRWLCAPPPDPRRPRLEKIALGIWRDLPVESFAPERRLGQIAAEYLDAEIVVFAPSVGWDTSLFQRPQQLARALAGCGCLVFYAEHFDSRRAVGFHALGDRLYQCNVPADCFRALERAVVVTHTYNKYYLSNFRSPRVVYDYLDDLHLHSGAPAEVAQDHIDLLKMADVVLATAESLLEQVAPLRADAILCPNGADYDHFHAPGESNTPLPADLARWLDQNKPIILYYGALARWFDYDLLRAVAMQRGDLNFLLIGNDYDGSLPASGILALPNVFWLGIRPYADLPAFLRACRAAIIPFRLTPITHATSPIKLFEYFAGGKPVVTTALRECLRYPPVLVARDAVEFSTRLDDALRLSSDSKYRESIDQIARENTWDARAEQILTALGGERGEYRGQPCRESECR